MLAAVLWNTLHTLPLNKVYHVLYAIKQKPVVLYRTALTGGLRTKTLSVHTMI